MHKYFSSLFCVEKNSVKSPEVKPKEKEKKEMSLITGKPINLYNSYTEATATEHSPISSAKEKGVSLKVLVR